MSQNKSYSYWEKDTFLRPYDLVVVGAGIVGLSSALFYRKAHPGHRILVIDKGWIPEGASTRNAGFACVGSITEHMADLDRETGENIKKRIQTRYEGLNLLKKTLGEDSIGYRPCGGYELFTRRDAFDEAREHLDTMNRWLEEMTGEASVYSAGTLNGYDVIHNRLEGALHPGKMMQQLIKTVSETGVEIKWNTKVKRTGAGGEVQLVPGISLQADRVLIASNGFTKRLLPDIEIKPARGYVIVSSRQEHLAWKGTFHHDRGYMYFRDVGDRLLLGGARNIAESEEETDEFGTNEAIRDHLVHFADEVLKLEKGWEVAEEWSGIMGFTRTKTPVVRQLDKHRYVVAGLSGMGVAIGMKIGQEAAEMVA